MGFAIWHAGCHQLVLSDRLAISGKWAEMARKGQICAFSGGRPDSSPVGVYKKGEFNKSVRGKGLRV